VGVGGVGGVKAGGEEAGGGGGGEDDVRLHTPPGSGSVHMQSGVVWSGLAYAGRHGNMVTLLEPTCTCVLVWQLPVFACLAAVRGVLPVLCVAAGCAGWFVLQLHAACVWHGWGCMCCRLLVATVAC